MTRFYFHLRGSDELLDTDGVLATVDELRSIALRAARDVMCGDVRRGTLDLRLRIDVEAEAGMIILSLPFHEAISVVADIGDTHLAA
jgi:hypothetical protein